ncbi:Subtilisin-like protease-like protein [Heracleum sosnowskyi]|uniref:Subtilisin-like protease-like protein n=1 Tax=Heracleum sosnowskyi TaxID=360622 RepID=A0AAD8N1R2_9APIA|nr:Subtilisin-like protease-like protein [Heracleum sosnowskyi]
MNVLQLLTILVFFRSAFAHGTRMNKKHYIVYMGHHSHPDVESVITANHDMLASVIGRQATFTEYFSSFYFSHPGIYWSPVVLNVELFRSLDGARKASIHHYTKSFRGFSAMLTPDQAQELQENDSVISIFESRTNHVHTTNSWNFLAIDKIKQYNHLPMDIKSDTIVGVIDTGVWPESESFNDRGLGPLPTKFKGECVTGDNFTLSHCNRKIIGARFYYGGIEAVFGPLEKSKRTFFRSARDSDGHGTHLASIVAGSMVANASYYRIGKGTLRGGAPSARLAIYKACWFGICIDADVL